VKESSGLPILDDKKESGSDAHGGANPDKVEGREAGGFEQAVGEGPEKGHGAGEGPIFEHPVPHVFIGGKVEAGDGDEHKERGKNGRAVDERSHGAVQVGRSPDGNKNDEEEEAVGGGDFDKIAETNFAVVHGESLLCVKVPLHFAQDYVKHALQSI
jgi:hypothetical protein